MINFHAQFPNLLETIGRLAELAGNLLWSWRPQARMLFKMLNRQA
jgi:glycogen phosphorylase